MSEILGGIDVRDGHVLTDAERNLIAQAAARVQVQYLGVDAQGRARYRGTLAPEPREPER